MGNRKPLGKLKLFQILWQKEESMLISNQQKNDFVKNQIEFVKCYCNIYLNYLTQQRRNDRGRGTEGAV